MISWSVLMSEPSPNVLLGNVVKQLGAGGDDLRELYPLLRGLYAVTRGETLGTPGGVDFLDVLVAEGATKPGIDAGALRTAVVASFRDGRPQDVLHDPSFQDAVVFGAMQALRTNGSEVDEAHVRAVGGAGQICGRPFDPSGEQSH